VRGSVLIANCPIAGGRDYCPSLDYDCADWNFIALRGVAREVESVPNVLLVGSQRLRADAQHLRASALICLQALTLSLS
jgi:hypothetical protein